MRSEIVISISHAASDGSTASAAAVQFAIAEFEGKLKARIGNDTVVTELGYVSGPDGCTSFAVSARMDLTDLRYAIERTLADLKLSGQIQSHTTG